jgi:sugar lactone lactonase YvrE
MGEVYGTILFLMLFFVWLIWLQKTESPSVSYLEKQKEKQGFQNQASPGAPAPTYSIPGYAASGVYLQVTDYGDLIVKNPAGSVVWSANAGKPPSTQQTDECIPDVMSYPFVQSDCYQLDATIKSNTQLLNSLSMGVSCEAGYYCDGTGSTTTPTRENMCPSGTYCPVNSKEPTDCPAGQYSSAGAALCTDCPAGKYSSGGATVCEDCPAGQSSDSGESSCRICPVGYYCPGGGSVACPAGKTSAGGATATSSAACTNCPAGEHSLAGGTCINCPVGYYCTGNGIADPCPAGKTSMGTQRSIQSCVSCPPGQSSEAGGTCTPCSPGRSSFSGGPCFDCQQGAHCPGGIGPADCRAGYYCPWPAATPVHCGAGKSSPRRSISVEDCTVCPTAYYCPANEVTMKCPAGKTSTGGLTATSVAACTNCPIGQTSVAGGLCEPCPAGHYCPGGVPAVACPSGKISAGGVTSISADTCSSCPAGKTPSLAKNNCVNCLAGQYSLAGGPCTDCPRGQSSVAGGQCEYCPIGQYQSGSACLNCPSGQSSTVGICTSCPSGQSSVQGGACCSAGYVSVTGSTSGSASGSMRGGKCNPCPEGYYCPTGTSSIPCVAGKTSIGGPTAINISACINCSSYYGYYCPAGGSPIIPCNVTRLTETLKIFTTPIRFNKPFGLALDSAGNIYVADTYFHTIRKIGNEDWNSISLVAGTRTAGFVSGTGSAARFNHPSGIVVDSQGYIYVADTHNNRIRLITPAGVVLSSVAGSGTAGFADGTGTAAQFNKPTGVALDSQGNVYVADSENHRIRKITSPWVVTTVAGSGTAGFANGTGIAAQFNKPTGLTVDSQGNVYVADSENHRIRKITPAGVVSTVAGSGTAGFANGAGTAAQFNYPYGIFRDSMGILYITDSANKRIRKITPAGVVSTLAGNGLPGSADEVPLSSSFYNPKGIAVGSDGTVYITDSDDNALRIIRQDCAE